MQRQWSADSVYEGGEDAEVAIQRSKPSLTRLAIWKPRRHGRRKAGAPAHQGPNSASSSTALPHEEAGSVGTRRHRPRPYDIDIADQSQYSSAVYGGGPSGTGTTAEISSDETSTDTEVKRFSWDVPRRGAGKNADTPPSSAPRSPRGMNHIPLIADINTAQAPSSSLQTQQSLDGSASTVHLARGHRKMSTNEAASNKEPRIFAHANIRIELALHCAAAAMVSWQLYRTENVALRASATQLTVLAILSIAILSVYNWRRAPVLWSTESRHYRDAKDQGIISGLLMGPILAAACLIQSYRQETGRTQASFEGWILIPPGQDRQYAGLGPLTTARKALLSIQSVIFVVNAVHIFATTFFQPRRSPSEGAWARLSSYIRFGAVLTTLIAGAHACLRATSFGLWSSLSPWEILLVCILYHASLYSITRLARKNFTFGELSIVTVFGVTLMIEAAGLSLAKLYPTTTVLHTFRIPNALLVFQLALIVGAFTIGFLNSPLLYLSRYLAQRPTHRLRWPQKRDLHRKLLSGSFFLFAAAFVFGVLGLWVKWINHGRNPWLWTFNYILQGERWWSRPALITYWLVLISSSVTAWQAIVSRGRKYNQQKVPVRIMPASNIAAGFLIKEVIEKVGVSVAKPSPSSPSQAASVTTQNDGQAPARKTTYLSLNAKRKSFHALAVAMFVPAIMLDPDFTHLALSLAFSAFIFAEYIRYFALYPLGAPVHIFLSEFLDQKDSGPVILSHFYLLSGCALPLWLQGSSILVKCSGVLVLGIGDALASIVGRRYGKVHWPLSSKTVEGSLAFIISIYASGLMLQAMDKSSSLRPLSWLYVVVTLGIFEGASEQNDNLILPIFAYVLCSIAEL